MRSALRRLIARIFSITVDDIGPNIIDDSITESSNQLNESSCIHNGFSFKILFSKGSWLILEFDQIESLEAPIHPSGFQQVQGILRFDYQGDGGFKITLVESLYDLISSKRSDLDQKYHADMGANGIKFESRYSSYLVDNQLHVLPISVDEEGWNFAFTEANVKRVGEYDFGNISAEKNIRNFITAQSLTWTITSHQRSSREVYEKSRMNGTTRHIVSVEFTFMDLFRKRFVQAFGTKLLELAAAERGLEIDHSLKNLVE